MIVTVQVINATQNIIPFTRVIQNVESRRRGGSSAF
jgi:hypothetical protein